MEDSAYIKFCCPYCDSGMEIIEIGEQESWFKCPRHGNVHSVSTKFRLINEKRLKKEKTNIYALTQGFSGEFLTALDSLRKSLEKKE